MAAGMDGVLQVLLIGLATAKLVRDGEQHQDSIGVAPWHGASLNGDQLLNPTGYGTRASWFGLWLRQRRRGVTSGGATGPA